ncbi:response regulator transcription factor [Paenibacillus macquariensis]|uniref:DNA-binding response regulator, OmpR family, contains REC and winged-helix (WHTH) domain n=1 Tax=Paenibacillus macquariensis TaxID=948756 RepID=A0ABY1K7F0_9BACL|nr:response regulator transcription factor [Paenibacillus macquariensis]MEC0091062.1 response regulator transcription factor [Paenibacillus macquariensis]OAB33749.1 DNA-binding response regulator [Paenibacillus macquariensis subsp. macquariensis]SIR36769.1 DNA-binding response regulator, OmpR family, contains REC and winged-helix (wHTH) domain [Paenibacillus macquariensis]
MKKVLIVEDELNFSRFLELELNHESYEVTVAYDGPSGLHLALEQEWDMILLDVMLPGINGIEVCKEIRNVKKTPIIMLTARNNVTDRILGLDCGADDYIPKPFAIEELFARMRAIFRRYEDSEQRVSILTFHDLVLDLNARIIEQSGEMLDLTKREFDLLVFFMQNINLVLSRDTLLDKVWGYNTEVESNVVDVYVRYLRNKLNDCGDDKYIHTLRGIGYVMRS